MEITDKKLLEILRRLGTARDRVERTKDDSKFEAIQKELRDYETAQKNTAYQTVTAVDEKHKLDAYFAELDRKIACMVNGIYL